MVIQDDVLQWLIENAERKHYSDADIVESFFMIHLAATYNTTNVGRSRFYSRRRTGLINRAELDTCAPPPRRTPRAYRAPP